MPRPDWGPTVRMKKGKNNERAIRKCLPIKGEATGLFLWKLSSTILRLCRRQWLKPSQNVPEVLYNKRRIDKPPWQGLLCPTGWGIWLSNPDRGRGLLFQRRARRFAGRMRRRAGYARRLYVWSFLLCRSRSSSFLLKHGDATVDGSDQSGNAASRAYDSVGGVCQSVGHSQEFHVSPRVAELFLVSSNSARRLLFSSSSAAILVCRP